MNLEPYYRRASTRPDRTRDAGGEGRLQGDGHHGAAQDPRGFEREGRAGQGIYINKVPRGHPSALFLTINLSN